MTMVRSISILQSPISNEVLKMEHDLIPLELDRPREACGVFGIYAPGRDVARLTFFGLFALQHRGQ
jgi:amidophosphoribosyltransferase